MHQNDDIDITFFMLVTSKDICIADYTIRSYNILQKLNLRFKLLIYANCLETDEKKRYFPRWSRWSFVEIFDNYEYVKGMRFRRGEIITSPEGVQGVRPWACENYDEIWSRELRKIETRYHATVDADFEILRGDFVIMMLKELDSNPNLVAMSSDYGPTSHNYFDSYSQTHCGINERWHTWFCIYKKEAQKCNVSHFYYHEYRPDGVCHKYDSASYFQKHLRENFGYDLRAVDKSYQDDFIHYGAISHQKSLHRGNIWLYRFLAINAKVCCIGRKGETGLRGRINGYSREIARRLFRLLFAKAEAEKRRYDF